MPLKNLILLRNLTSLFLDQGIEIGDLGVVGMDFLLLVLYDLEIDLSLLFKILNRLTLIFDNLILFRFHHLKLS